MGSSLNRRGFLFGVSSLPAIACAAHWQPMLALQRTPQPIPSPNAPKNQNVPGGLNTLPSEGPVKPPPVIEAAQITAMVQQLYRMAEELKQETEHTNLRDMLPVDFIPRTQQIEKLAKSIRNKAKG